VVRRIAVSDNSRIRLDPHVDIATGHNRITLGYFDLGDPATGQIYWDL
jgi:hypothetical protein